MSVIDVTTDEAVTIITITRPHRRNAINRETADALREAWLAFEADDSQRVGIITGGDDVFCAGADLKELTGLDNNSEVGPLGYTRLFINKPTLAAVAGYCVAGGLELACWCDMRIADETAIFGCFERRFGVPLIDGGTQRLPRIVGLGRALDMILTGRPVDAQEAYRIGLANEAVPKGQHVQRALEIGKLLATFPQTAMLHDRRAVYEGLGTTIAAGLQIERKLGQASLDNREAHAGAAAFTQGKGRGGEFG